MINKIFKLAILLISLIAGISLASAANMTLDGLIESLNYSYSDGTLSLVSKNDFMLDKDSDGLNDTLIIELTATSTFESAYNFVITLLDNNKIYVNTTNQTVLTSNTNIQINIPSDVLGSIKFNYTIKVYNQDNELVYREYKTETNAYTNYEKGTNITRITDENLNNNFIRINLTINSTQNITTNVTVTLAYNLSTISKSQEKTLSNGIQVVSIDFDNETIKSTHYIGNFTIDTIVIGNKIFNFNQNTSIYNYEDFAKTPYIKSIADGRIDTNANNLSEFLEINFTINVKTADTYNLTYDLYDQFNNFVISANKTQTLALGNQIVQTLINGSEIYKTKINGPYVLSFVKLAIGNDTKDIIFNAYTTNQSFYTDYERPPLPDLKVGMSVLFDANTNITNITVNVSNIGQAPASNVFFDIFDNTTYVNNRSLSFLSNNETITYKFNITNSSNTTLYTSIVDFDNLVDESNESNNIIQNTQVNLTSELQDINKFFIKNSSGSNIAWFGDAGNIVIKGKLEQNSNFQATNNFAFKIRNNLNDVLIIENNGSMYIDGNLSENQATITSNINRNDFRVKNNGTLMININETGYVFLKGTLTQNGNP